mmetsp:Transcript_18731/g.38023  ORF Transcript_18731/g.38023 Transcript_18731/m.38023 type:complete len:205 (+) Transcript_18731:99-713(+)
MGAINCDETLCETASSSCFERCQHQIYCPKRQGHSPCGQNMVRAESKAQRRPPTEGVVSSLRITSKLKPTPAQPPQSSGLSNQGSFGPVISSGLIHSSNCSAVRNPLATAASFSVVPSLCAFFAMTLALSYPMCGFRAVTSIKLPRSSSSIRPGLGAMPSTHRTANDDDASPKSRAELSRFDAITGLNTFSSKCPCMPPIVTAA